MPLRCIDREGNQYHSFLMDEYEWTLLSGENKILKHLRMPCCAAPVVLKKSKLGTRFFAHQRKGPCVTKPESPEHLLLKSEVAAALLATGWDVTTEERGESAEGESWVADVLATKGRLRYAIEVQWSKQTDEKTIQRHFRYRASNVRCLWLFKQNPLRDALVPALKVSQASDGRFYVPVDRWVYQPEIADTVIEPDLVPLRRVIEHVFSGQHLWFGVYRAGHHVVLDLLGWNQKCDNCGDHTKLINTAVLRGRDLPTVYLNDYGLLLLEHFYAQIEPGVLKKRQLNTNIRYKPSSYGHDNFANKCFHCGSLVRKVFSSLKMNDSEVPLFTHEVVITPPVAGELARSRQARWNIDIDFKQSPTTDGV